LTLTVQPGEVAYVARNGSSCVSAAPTTGAAGDACVWANANLSNGNPCVANSVVDKIVVQGSGTYVSAEKAVFDFTNGLFNVATTTTPLMSIALDNPTTGAPTSKAGVIAPATGGNMALALSTTANGIGSPAVAVNQLCVNTLSTRTAVYADMTVAASKATMVTPAFEFFGGAGPNVFTGDIEGWTTLPLGWATLANLTAKNFGQVVAAGATTLTLTATGGNGNDILAGGAGASNTLLGGPGNDTFLESVNLHAETIYGGDGVDTVDYHLRPTSGSGTTNSVFITPNSETGIAALTVASGGVGYCNGDVITVPGGTAGGLLATATVTGTNCTTTPVGGAVTGLTLTSNGDGYASSNVGLAATNFAVTNRTGAGLSAVTLDSPNPGTGYCPGDIVSIAGGTAGALATATVATLASGNCTAPAHVGGPIATLTLTSPGEGYTTAAVTAVNAAALTNVTVTNATAGGLPLGAGWLTADSAALGTNYKVNDVVTITTGGATAKVTSIGAGGSVSGLSVLTAGTAYTSASAAGGAATTGGSGTALKVDYSACPAAAAAGAKVDFAAGTVGAAGLTVAWTANTANDGAVGEGDSIDSAVEVFVGGGDNDVISAAHLSVGVGNTANQYPPSGALGTGVVIIGGPGNDQITGGPGNDDLCGGSGNDVFYDNPGNDHIVGGGPNSLGGTFTASPGTDNMVDYTGAAGALAGAVPIVSGTPYAPLPKIRVCLDPVDPTCVGGNTKLPVGTTTKGLPKGAGTLTVDPTADHSANYTVGDVVFISGGAAGDLAQATVTAVTAVDGGASGVVTSLSVAFPGGGYAAAAASGTGAATTNMTVANAAASGLVVDYAIGTVTTNIPQNGGMFNPATGAASSTGTPEADVINDLTVTKVCPSSTLYINNTVGGYTTVAFTTGTTPALGASGMAADIQDIRGPSPSGVAEAVGAILSCVTGGTSTTAVACTVYGGAGDDVIFGSSLQDKLYGGGGSDDVFTNAGGDMVDFTHGLVKGPANCGATTGSSVCFPDVSCALTETTVLTTGGDSVNGSTDTVLSTADTTSCVGFDVNP
jgi:hypothetical protein